MWEYTDKVQEYYRNPKNVGEIENADAVGETGSIVCGDALKLFLKIDNNGIITDAKFRTFGCGSAVASSSALTEMIIGKHVDEAEKLTNKDIADFLGGLPPEKMHCSVMGKEALEDAIANYKGIPVVKDKDERVVCKCFGTTEKKLREIINENGITNLCDATNYCKTGGGCGHCREDVQKVIEEETAKQNQPKTPEKLTKTQMILKVNKVLENYISNELRKDNGDIELVDVDDNKVFVRLLGMCKNCPSSNLTLKNFVESVLKEQINDNIEVIDVSN
jgi:NifU-like protein